MFERISGKATRIKATYVKPICTCSICQSKPASNVGCQNGAPAVCQIPKDRGGIFQGGITRERSGVACNAANGFVLHWACEAFGQNVPQYPTLEVVGMKKWRIFECGNEHQSTRETHWTHQLEAFNRRHKVLTLVPISQKSLRHWTVEKPCDGGTRCWLLPADCSSTSDTELSSFQAPTHNRSAKRSKRTMQRSSNVQTHWRYWRVSNTHQFTNHYTNNIIHMAMDQYLLIPFLGGWTSIYQLFWCSPGVQGFDTLPYHVISMLNIYWIYWLQVLRIITALWHHHDCGAPVGPWHSPLPSLLPQGFRASPRCKGLHRRLTRKFWISLWNYIFVHILYYIYIYL